MSVAKSGLSALLPMSKIRRSTCKSRTATKKTQARVNATKPAAAKSKANKNNRSAAKVASKAASKAKVSNVKANKNSRSAAKVVSKAASKVGRKPTVARNVVKKATATSKLNAAKKAIAASADA